MMDTMNEQGFVCDIFCTPFSSSSNHFLPLVCFLSFRVRKVLENRGMADEERVRKICYFGIKHLQTDNF